MPTDDCTPLSAVVFDLDGLMFDTETLYTDTARQILRRRDQELSDELVAAMMGRKSEESLAIMIRSCDLSDTVEQLRAETNEIFARLIEQELAPMPGLWGLLDALSAHQFPLGIATSSRCNNVDPILDKFQLRERFQFVLTAKDVVQGKPHPEIYLTAAQKLGVSAAQVMVFEDSQIGCRAAVAAGAFTVAVPANHSRDHDFEGVAFVAQGLDDVRIRQALGI